MDEKEVLKNLIQHQYEVNKENQTILHAIASTNDSILNVAKEMGETNKCVMKTLDANTSAVIAIERFWGRIVIILVAVISVLAGVKSVSEILGAH